MIYVLFFLVAIALVLNRISKSYVLHDFSYSREISKKTVEIDEEFEIATVAENNKLLPITFLQIIEKLPQALKYRFKAGVTESGEYIFHKMAMMMLPYQRIKRVYKVTSRKIHLQRCDLDSRGYVGLEYDRRRQGAFAGGRGFA